jgi:hypothetical protein
MLRIATFYSGWLLGLALTASNPGQFALAERYFSYEPYALMLRRGDPDFRLR